MIYVYIYVCVCLYVCICIYIIIIIIMVFFNRFSLEKKNSQDPPTNLGRTSRHTAEPSAPLARGATAAGAGVQGWTTAVTGLVATGGRKKWGKSWNGMALWDLCGLKHLKHGGKRWRF